MAQHCYQATREQEAILQWLVNQRNAEKTDVLTADATVDDIVKEAVDRIFERYGHDVQVAKRLKLAREISLGNRDDLLEAKR